MLMFWSDSTKLNIIANMQNALCSGLTILTMKHLDGNYVFQVR